MRELLVRTVSGLLYVALIVFSACWSQPSFLIVLFVFSTLALIEFQKLTKHKSPVSFLLFGLLTYQFYTQNVHPTLNYGLLILTLLTSLYLTYCLLKDVNYPSAPLEMKKIFLTRKASVYTSIQRQQTLVLNPVL